MENNYYVYLYRRNDSDDVCYIGKGRNRRAYQITSHNKHCINIDKLCGITVEIIKENLSNEEALNEEERLIDYYVNTLGYSIDIYGYRNSKNPHMLCNKTFGGYKNTKPWTKEDIIRAKEFYQSEKGLEIRRKISEIQRNRFKTEVGIEQQRRMTEKAMEFWNSEQGEKAREKVSDSLCKYYQTEKGLETRRKMSEKRVGFNNSASKNIICVETNKLYSSTAELARELNKNYDFIRNRFRKSKDNTIELDIDGEILHFIKTS